MSLQHQRVKFQFRLEKARLVRVSTHASPCTPPSFKGVKSCTDMPTKAERRGVKRPLIGSTPGARARLQRPSSVLSQALKVQGVRMELSQGASVANAHQNAVG